MFNCKSCEYITKNKSDYNRHILTSKHKSNNKLTFNCDNCAMDFSSKSTYHRHNKKCIDGEYNDLDNNIKIVKLKCENKLLQTEIEKKELIHEKEKYKIKSKCDKEKAVLLEKLLNDSQITTKSAMKLSSDSISAIKYANKYYNNAPALEDTDIEDFKLLGLDITIPAEKEQLINSLIYNIKKKNFREIIWHPYSKNLSNR